MVYPLVAPPAGACAVIGEHGWRAKGVICLGRLAAKNVGTVAQLILAAHVESLTRVLAILSQVTLAKLLEAKRSSRPAVAALTAHFTKGEEENRRMLPLPCLDESANRFRVAECPSATHDTATALDDYTLH